MRLHLARCRVCHRILDQATDGACAECKQGVDHVSIFFKIAIAVLCGLLLFGVIASRH